MRFKNYRNSYTNDNRIYSKQEMLEMPIKEFKNRAEEFIAQHEVLGLPDESELSQSDNVVHVEAYTREDGTEVKAHWRSKPGVNSDENSVNKRADSANNENNYDNADWEGNPEGSQEYYESQKYEESEEYKKEYREREKQKSIERKDPDEIAGVKRGEPMTFEEADSGKVNPKYIEEDGYDENCAACIYTYECRRRGFDVESTPVTDGNATEEIGKNFFGSWLEPNDNSPCTGVEINIKKENCYDFFSNKVSCGERYALVNYYDEEFEGKIEKKAHVVMVEKDANDSLILYDAQSNSVRKGDTAYEYVKTWMGQDAQYNPKYLRIDDKKLSSYYYNRVVIPSS